MLKYAEVLFSSVVRTTYARIVFKPLASLLYDYKNPISLATANCLDKIYPYVAGISYTKHLRAAVMDDYGNHLICG